MKHKVFITGGTGYMGSRLIPLLVERGHEVKALVRPGSERRLHSSAAGVPGDPLQVDSYTAQVTGCDTFVHLIGVPHPSPSKTAQFRAVDAVSIRVASQAAQSAGIRHFVYLSVAHPAPMMQAYIEVRSEGEALIRSLNLPATFVRPWYVLGPGHRWPYVLLPFYWLCERLPNTRETARRLGLVTIGQMTSALLWAVENPTSDVRILDVPGIREAASESRAGVSSPILGKTS
jgi:uncharacterized protein YbjT (DUF2867 family)